MRMEKFIDIFKTSFDNLDSDISENTIYKEIEKWTSMQSFFRAHLNDATKDVLNAFQTYNLH